MRKISLLSLKIITIFFLFILGIEAKAQSNWEVGGRFGDGFALDMTIPLAKAPRLHPAVYFNNDIAIGTYFDWMFSLAGGPTGLKFYPGVGPELYFYNGLDIAVAGDFGAEYSFDFPLTVGLDWRPNFMISDSFRFHRGNWGLIARFRFGEGVKFVKSK